MIIGIISNKMKSPGIDLKEFWMPDTMFIRLTEALNNMVAIITSINDG